MAAEPATSGDAASDKCADLLPPGDAEEVGRLGSAVPDWGAASTAAHDVASIAAEADPEGLHAALVRFLSAIDCDCTATRGDIGVEERRGVQQSGDLGLPLLDAVRRAAANATCAASALRAAASCARHTTPKGPLDPDVWSPRCIGDMAANQIGSSRWATRCAALECAELFVGHVGSLEGEGMRDDHALANRLVAAACALCADEKWRVRVAAARVIGIAAGEFSRSMISENVLLLRAHLVAMLADAHDEVASAASCFVTPAESAAEAVVADASLSGKLVRALSDAIVSSDNELVLEVVHSALVDGGGTWPPVTSPGVAEGALVGCLRWPQLTYGAGTACHLYVSSSLDVRLHLPFLFQRRALAIESTGGAGSAGDGRWLALLDDLASVCGVADLSMWMLWFCRAHAHVEVNLDHDAGADLPTATVDIPTARVEKPERMLRWICRVSRHVAPSPEPDPSIYCLLSCCSSLLRVRQGTSALDKVKLPQVRLREAVLAGRIEHAYPTVGGGESVFNQAASQASAVRCEATGDTPSSTPSIQDVAWEIAEITLNLVVRSSPLTPTVADAWRELAAAYPPYLPWSSAESAGYARRVSALIDANTVVASDEASERIVQRARMLWRSWKDDASSRFVVVNLLSWLPRGAIRGDRLGHVIPIALELMDDAPDVNVWLGASLLNHILERSLAPELRWHEGIFMDKLTRASITRNPTIQWLVIRMRLVVAVALHGPLPCPAAEDLLGDALRSVAQPLSAASSLPWLCCIFVLVEALQASTARHVAEAVTRLRIVAAEGADPACTLVALSALQSIVQGCWPCLRRELGEAIVAAACRVYVQAPITMREHGDRPEVLREPCMDLCRALAATQPGHRGWMCATLTAAAGMEGAVTPLAEVVTRAVG